jgi:hypothetical protein
VVIVSEQMQDAVDEVADNLGLPGGAKALRLQNGFVHADEEFPGDFGSGVWGLGSGVSKFRVVEGNYVGGAFMLEKLLVDAGHFRRGDEGEAEFGIFDLRQFLQQRDANLTKQAEVDWSVLLTIVNQDCVVATV